MLKPILFSRIIASRARTIRVGTRCSATRAIPRRRSFSAKRARERRRFVFKLRDTSVNTIRRTRVVAPLVIHYDDFNTFLGNFSNRLGRRGKRPDRVLAEWKLWDHMDSILSLGVTGLIDRILEVKQPTTTVECDLSPTDLHALDRPQVRDLLLLATCYDQSTAEPFEKRWHKLCKTLRFRTWTNHWDLAVGILATLGVIGLLGYLSFTAGFQWVGYWWVWALVVLAAWAPRAWHWGRAWRRAQHFSPDADRRAGRT